MTQGLLPVARPQLVAAEDLLDYFREIDAARTYSNFGPMILRLESRLGAHFGLDSGSVVTVMNGTMGLTACLMEDALPGRSLCVMPSWTFCASAHAALAAGLQPFFVDVDPFTWQIDPDAVAALPHSVLKEVAAVMPVASFGSPIDGRRWDAFAAATNLPVVIDAAAAFDSMTPARSPSVVSLHATKALGIGEGGFVATTDPGHAARIRTRVNFGFAGTRQAKVNALNGKMSEYAAAVALAALDAWPAKRRRWGVLRDCYRQRLASARPGWFAEEPEQGWVTSTFVLATRSQTAEVRTALRRHGIDSRSWWEAGCHREPAFAACRSGMLTATDHLARHSVGLPFFPDLEEDDITRVVDALAPHLGERPPAYAVFPNGQCPSRVHA